MKRSILLSRNRMSVMLTMLAAFFLSGSIAKAQSISNYAFSASSSPFTPLVGGTAVPALLGDDVNSGTIPLGFTFYYMGAPYTQVTANSNGWISFNATPTASTTSMRTNSLSTGNTGLHPIIAPVWDDLMGINSSGTPAASYLTTGAPGSQVFTMEWLNWAPYSSVVIAPTISFQVKLYEATGRIEFSYRQEAGTTAFSGASIGISNSSTSYASLNGATASPTVSNSTSTNNITARPASNQLYAFTPPGVPAAPSTMTFSAVTATSMNVQWLDNSSSEFAFRISRSTDNVTFTQIGQVASTTTAGTGTMYSLVQTGLAPGTTYYYRVTAVSESGESGNLQGSQATNAGTLCGTKIVGPTGDFPSLTAAFNDIAINGLACPLLIELQPTYVSTVETFPININNYGNTSTQTITVRPQLGASNLSILSGAAQTININGGVYVTFDGRAGGTGTSRELTIIDTVTTGNAVRFINGASNNTFTYVNIKGRTSSTTNGVVAFSTTTGTGNSNNTISNSTLGDFTSLPTNIIYSAGTAGADNVNNVITGNLIFNYYSASTASNGINLQANNSGWNISNNSFFQTAIRTSTAGALHAAITINSSTGNGYIITNNFIGGSAANAGGAPTTYDGAFGNRFAGINLVAVGTTAASGVHGNVISNIVLNSNSSSSTIPAIFSGISIQSGSANIGTVTPNTIGSTTGTGNINIVTSSNTGGAAFGISSTSSGTVNISNNTIGSVSLSNPTSVAVRTSFTGIAATSGTVTISNNLIGSLSTAGSITNTTGNTSTLTPHVTAGIAFSGTTGTITNNTVSNLVYNAGATVAQVIGLNITSGTVTATGNTISNLSNASPYTGTSFAVAGIIMTATGGSQTISQNMITNLYSTSATAAVTIAGIHYSGPSTGTSVVERNLIRALYASTSGVAVITGINVAGGVTTYSNNMIDLGLDVTAAPVTAPYAFTGILKNTTANNNFYFNSIRIQGSGVGSTTTNTYAFRRMATGTDELRNNIITNFRTNAAAGGNHYAISLNATTTFTAGNNDYFVTGGMLGNVGTTDYATLSAWKAGTGLDATSFGVNPNFISSTNLHISNSAATSLESGAAPIPGITIDYDGDVRPGPVGSINGGGTNPDIGADEFDGIPVTLDIGAFALVNPATSGCFTGSETVRIRIKNFSSTSIDFSVDNVTITSSVTGPNAMVFAPIVLNSGTLAGGATLDTTVSANYSMLSAGTYTFNATATVMGDGSTGNDAMPTTAITVGGGTASASATSVCSTSPSAITLTLAGYNNGTIQWQSSTDGGTTWNNETGTGNTSATYTVTPTMTTAYRALVCGLHNSNTVTVTYFVPPAPTVTGDTRCGTGPVSLTASGTSPFNWYAGATGGSPIFTGANYTPTLSATTTYYVSAGGVNASVGPLDNTIGTGTYSTVSHYQIFTVFSNTTLNGVYVYPNAAGNVVLELQDNTGAVITSTTYAVTTPNVKTFIPLGWNLTPGTNYRLARGSASVSLYRNDTGANYPYTLPGVLSITGNSFSTTYVYWAYDWQVSTGCESARVPVTATVNPAPAITVAPATQAICSGQTASVSVTSSNPDYTYTWTPGNVTGATQTFTPSSTTTYTVTALDNTSGTYAGCTITATTSVTVNPLPVIHTSTATPSTVCSGGTVNLNATTPTPMTAAVGTNNGTNSINGSPYRGGAGSGVKIQYLFTAAELNAAGINAGNINSLTFTTSTAGSGGLVNFTIRMEATSVTALTTTFQPTPSTVVYGPVTYTSVLGANTHTFTTPFNWNGTSNILIQVCHDTPSPSGSSTNVQRSLVPNMTTYTSGATACATSTTGTLDTQRPLITFGATAYSAGTFTWAWNPGNLSGNSVTVNPVNTTTSPAVSNYTVTLTNPSTGCVSTATVPVTVNPNPVATISSTNVLCTGNNTGEATVTATSGSGTYSYSWNTTPAQTTATITGLTAGSYAVTVTDGNLCTTTASVTITEPAAALSATMMSTNVSCTGGNNGDAMAMPMGGTMPYTYMWSNGQTTQTATGLAAGSYSVTVTDANMCTTTASVTITEPATALSATMMSTNVSCNGGNNGDAMVMPMGGTGAYSYLWSDGQTTQTATGLTAGSYSVTVTDANMCTTTASVTITQPAVLAATMMSSNVSCFGGNNGDAMVMPTGGTGAYTYVWSDGQTTQTATGLVAGSYTVTVMDANSCTTTATVTITEPAAALSAMMMSTNVSCNGGNNGDAMAMPMGGTMPYTYMWSDGQTTQTATGLVAGTYSVTVTDANMCTTTASVTITEPAVLAAAATSTNETCSPGADGTATAMPSGGTGNYTYMWSDAAMQTTATATGLTAGTYTVTINDGACPAITAVVTVSGSTPPVVTASNDTTICEGSMVTLIATGGGNYAWDNGAGSNDTVMVMPSNTTIYTVTVTDNNGCVATESVTVTVDTIPTASFTSMTNGLDVTFTNTSMNGTSYSWDFGDGSPIDNSANPMHTYPFDNTWYATLIVSNGCSSDTITDTIVIITTGIADVKGMQMNVSPNPSEGIFTLSISDAASELNIDVMDVRGRVVYSVNESNVTASYHKQIDVTHLAKGVYTLMVNSGGTIVSKRIVVQ